MADFMLALAFVAMLMIGHRMAVRLDRFLDKWKGDSKDII